jgi:KDO2-lipid IV(A) lauroyltransferase
MSESIRIIRNPREAKVTGIESIEKLIQSADAAGKGHLIVTAHLGSWELVAYHGAKAASKPFHVLAKPPKNRGARKLLEELREQMGVRVLWTDRKTLLRDMLQNVRSGGSIGFVMDQKPEGRKGPVVNFFGHETEFVSGPAAIASKTGCAVISLFCVRVAPFHYHLVSRELLPPGTESSDTGSLTQAMAAEIERVIRLYPEQWCWNYKRWRFSSPGEL